MAGNNEAEGLEQLADAMAEFLVGIWQEEQHRQRTAAVAAASAEEPASASEATSSGI